MRRNGRKPKALIAGGGTAAIEALLALRSLLASEVQIELLAPEEEFVYRPLSVTEPFELAQAPRFDLARIAGSQGAVLHRDALSGVDTERHRVRTAGGAELGYDALIVAIGTEMQEAVPGAFTFRGGQDAESLAALLDRLEASAWQRLVFAAPSTCTWLLPLYELALMTSSRLRTNGGPSGELMLITAEKSPLAIFGAQASVEVARLLSSHGIELRTESHPTGFSNGRLQVVPDGVIVADQVVTLPRLTGRKVPGLPADAEGFLRVDGHCRIEGLSDVFAVGDITNFAVKQGGLATQQADIAAEQIAADFGAGIEPAEFHPVLRALLLSSAGPRYLRADVVGRGDDSEASKEALWWPSGKIAGRHLSPFLAAHAEAITRPPAAEDGSPVRPALWIRKG